MKINTLNTLEFVSFFCTSLAISIVLVIVSAMATARAHTRPLLNRSVLNGLYSPTAAERFFEEGRRGMEREIEIITRSRTLFS